MARLKLLSFVLVAFACYQHTPEPVTNQSLIAGTDAFGKTWRIVQIEVELGTLVPRTCLTDNFITYFPNGNYEINEGATKCNPSDPPAVVGTWEMNSSETEIFVTIGDSLQVWNLEAIDQQNQRISSEFTEGSRTYVLSRTN